MEASPYLKSVIDVLIHVIILFSFLSLFFFLYVSKLESTAFKSEFEDLIKNHVTNFSTDNQKFIEQPVIQEYIRRVINKYRTESKATVKQNTMIKYMAIFTIIILLGIVTSVILTTLFECNKKIDVGKIFFQNIIIFVFIGIVEYTFFVQVASKYTPVVPSTMIKSMFTAFKTTINPEN
jgi:hypothetical protein